MYLCMNVCGHICFYIDLLICLIFSTHTCYSSICPPDPQAQCTVTKLHALQGARSGAGAGAGAAAPKKPRVLVAGVQATVTICSSIPVLIEAFKDCKELGRFALRARGQTVAVGICEKVY
jgi:translation elongation factor EF-1alpha